MSPHKQCFQGVLPARADIALPEGVQAPSTEMDDPVNAQPQSKQPEKWGDLGLQSVH